jgi:hypothetical protein
MNELQQARSEWLKELSRNVELESEVQRLKQENFEFRSRLLVAQTISCIHEQSTRLLCVAFLRENKP